MGSLSTALQSGVQIGRDMWDEANHANGPGGQEMQAL